MAVDIEKMKAEVAKLAEDPAKLQAELLKIRTRQVAQQLKQKGKGGQQEYQKRQRERFKLLKELAVSQGLYDSINEQARKNAEAKVAEAVEKTA